MPGRLCACFILSVALWLNMFCVNDATDASTIVHRHKHHNNNHHSHHSSQHGYSNHHHVASNASNNNSNNNNNSHNSVSHHHMQNTHYYGRHKMPHHGSLLHQNKTTALHSIASTQNNRTVNNGGMVATSSSSTAAADARSSISASTSTQRTTGTATAAAIKSQKLSLINAHPVYKRFGGNAFNVDPSKRWPIMVAADNAHRIDTTNWRINFNPIVTTAAPNGIVHRVIFNDQRIFTKPNTQRGRHVCVEHKTSLMPITDRQTDRKEIALPCNDDKYCKNSKLYFETANAISQQPTPSSIVYTCCPGWSKIHHNSPGCNKPICTSMCKNGGKCVKPEQCHCPKGFTGAHCEQDINECITEKPCDQSCFNTHGSFYCTCRVGFILQADQQSCKKNVRLYGDDGDGNAFEARDLENDVDTDDLSAKINNLEKIVIGEKHRNVESTKQMYNTMETVKSLRLRIDGIESRQNEVNALRDKLNTFEAQAQKLVYTVDVLYKCRFNPQNYYCP